jgi:hypothetical protein
MCEKMVRGFSLDGGNIKQVNVETFVTKVVNQI